MYYIRMFSKPASYHKLNDIDSVENIGSDILHQELKTSDNTLSFWKCEDINDKDDTIKAILLSTNKIDSFKFIILDSKLLEKYNLEMVDNAMPTGYKGHDNLHSDLSYLTYKKIGDVLKVFSETVKNNKEAIVDYDKPQVTKIIKQLYYEDKIDLDKINDRLLKLMKKFIKEI